MGDSPVDQLKTATEAVGALIQAAGDSPEIQEAGRELGKTALTITKSINVVLLPLAAVNFAYDKARDYFSNKDKFEKEFSDATNSIPEENIVEPRPSIAGPVLQGLAFSSDEPALKDMYLKLLSSSMDSRVSGKIHPSFSEIIKQLNSEEANLLKSLLRSEGAGLIVRLTQEVKSGGYRSFVPHICDLKNDDGVRVENIMFPAYVDNWIRLGLVDVSYDEYSLREGAYDWVTERPEYTKYKKIFDTAETSISFEKGRIRPTAYGMQFAEAVGIYTPASALAAS